MRERIISGADPLQEGVAPGTIDARRAAGIRGSVQRRDGAPLASVTVTIAGHPEYGSTVTRTDGLLDLVVNGGEEPVVVLARSGYVTAHRSVVTRWEGHSGVEPVVLAEPDPAATPVELGPASPQQVAAGSPVVDADGRGRAC